jgi:hypothetical protein
METSGMRSFYLVEPTLRRDGQRDKTKAATHTGAGPPHAVANRQMSALAMQTPECRWPRVRKSLQEQPE